MKKVLLALALGIWGISLPIFAIFDESNGRLDSLIEKMTLEEKVGQLLMIGVKGKRLVPETKALIENLKVGGVIFYSHNVEDPFQIKDFIETIQELSSLPLFMAVDQEGGSVSRIRKNMYIMPSAMAIGATRSSQLSFQVGKLTGQDLKTLGINMNLAPVLDVNTNEYNSVIGMRSFGEDPWLVSQLGMWYIEGLQSQGVIATAKHFPGHGDTDQDSHYSLPVLNKELDDLEKFHLIPFRRAIENGLDAIMTAHISVPELDPSGLPATFSYNLLTTLVRDKMNFEGIIITDDLEMKSIQNDYGIGAAALKAITAGSDMVMVGWTSSKKIEVFQALLDGAKSGKLSQKRLDQSVKRILKLKLKRGLFSSDGRKPQGMALETLQNPLHARLSQKIAKQAITVVSNEGILPLHEEEGKRILLVTPFLQFYRNVKFFYEPTTSYFIPLRPTIGQIERATAEIIKVKRSYDVIIFGVNHFSQLEIINRVGKSVQKPLIVVSLGSPYFLRKLKNVSSYICSYGTEKELIYAAAQVLTGSLKPQGKLPVTLFKPVALEGSLTQPKTAQKISQK